MPHQINTRQWGQRAPFRKQKFQVAGIRSETEVLRCLLWMGFHCYTAASAAEPAGEGDGRCRWRFMRWSTLANTNTHTQKEPARLNVFSLPFLTFFLSLSHTHTRPHKGRLSSLRPFAFLTLTLIKAPAPAAAWLASA